MSSVKAKKSYGQHFLTDPGVARRIADTITGLPAAAGLPIVEIGPGTGALTRWLADAPNPLLAVEADPEAARYMRDAYPGVDLLEADFLRVDIHSLFPGSPIAVIGNYPYNISTQIFFHILDARDKVVACAGMLQREVAQRICADAGSRTYGILSVLLGLWYHREYLFTVDETVFHPRPKVKSGVLRLTRNDRTSLPCPEKLLRTIVKTTFGHRRKTLRNSLAPLAASLSHPLDDPRLAPWLPLRPEQLSPDDFITLTSTLSSPPAQD